MLTPPVTIPYPLRETFHRGLAQNKIIFLSAGPGWGKTAAAAQLLERQNAAFFSLSRRPLPRYFSRERLVVLDDFQALPAQDEGRFRDILRRSPSGQRFILLSRGPIPEYLSLYEATGGLLQLDETDLALNMNSLLQLTQAYGLSLSVRDLQRLLEETGGCPAAINLLLTALSSGQPLRRPAIDAMRTKMGMYLEEAALRPLPPETRKLLLELSLFDWFDQDLANMLAEDETAPGDLERLWRTSGLLQPAGAGWTIRDQRFLLPHLRQKLLTGPPTHLRAIHLAGGRWCAARQDLQSALYHYRQSDSREELLRLLIQTARRHPGVEMCRGLRDCIGYLTEKDILSSPDLICAMSLLKSMDSEPEEAERWYKSLSGCLRRMDHRDSDYKRVRGLRSYLDLSLSHRGTAELPKAILTADKLLCSKALVLPEFDLTGGLPSLLRGKRDFSQWVPRAQELYKTIGAPVERVLGRAGTGSGELALAESLLERGDDISERFLTLSSLRRNLRSNGTLELEFVLTALLVRALCSAGNLPKAQILLLQFRADAVRMNAPHVLSNADAMQCRLSLLEDSQFASDWSAEQDPGEEPLCWTESYRCLTKMRCLIKEGEHLAALLLSGRLLDYVQRHDRLLDLIETLTLTAICRFRMDCGDWQTYISHALRFGAQYGYTAVFAREGAALLPLLERCGHENLEPAYWNRVLSGTIVHAGYYDRYLQPSAAPLSPLTQKELMVLRLIGQNKTNEEICALLGIKLPTAKTHIRHLFKKLNAANRSEVQSAAKRLGLL